MTRSANSAIRRKSGDQAAPPFGAPVLVVVACAGRMIMAWTVGSFGLATPPLVVASSQHIAAPTRARRHPASPNSSDAGRCASPSLPTRRKACAAGPRLLVLEKAVYDESDLPRRSTGHGLNATHRHIHRGKPFGEATPDVLFLPGAVLRRHNVDLEMCPVELRDLELIGPEPALAQLFEEVHKVLTMKAAAVWREHEVIRAPPDSLEHRERQSARTGLPRDPEIADPVPNERHGAVVEIRDHELAGFTRSGLSTVPRGHLEEDVIRHHRPL